jgi:hypothetical protein
MKTKIFILFICNLLICNFLIAQNINLTLGSNGVFTIKDTSINYFTLSQSTGQVNMLNALRLENTTNLTTGVIYKGLDRFIHNYGASCTFMGINSGNFTMTGANNTALGDNTLLLNSTGNQNTAIGSNSLFHNTTGIQNTGLGYASLVSNSTGLFNTAMGSRSMQNNSTGSSNTSCGTLSLYSNTTGNFNSAFGTNALYNNTIGDNNVAFGNSSLNNNSTGASNTAVGVNSLQSNTTGLQNTALGYQSLLTNTTGSNNTAIGYLAQVPNGTGSNQISLGNTLITYAGIQVPWTITSDRRWKSDIQNSGLGLGFISKLRPVSYFRNNDESKKTEYGFIAQEVEEVLKETGTENTGMITIDDKGMYELRYNDLLAPMVKAIQELNEKCTTLEAENSQLKNEVESLKDMKVKLAELEHSQLELVKIIRSNSSKEIQSVKRTDNK